MDFFDSFLFLLLFRSSFLKSGARLLFHVVSNIVPSAAYVLTVVFGMGTGVSHRRIGTGFPTVLSKTEQYPRPLLLPPLERR